VTYRLVDSKDWLVGVTITKQNGSRGDMQEKRFFQARYLMKNQMRIAIPFSSEKISLAESVQIYQCAIF